jgi:hypothetical protein
LQLRPFPWVQVRSLPSITFVSSEPTKRSTQLNNECSWLAHMDIGM